MGDQQSKNKYQIYEAARDGAVDVLSDVLQQMSITERSSALKTKTKDGDQLTTPLIIAARNGNLDCAKMLLRFQADIEARGTVKVDYEVIKGCTPLWAAAATGHFDVVRLLIEQNADVDARTERNSTPLRTAAYNGYLDIVRCLVENGADVDACTIRGQTPLMMACYNGHLNVVTYLIENDATLNLQDERGHTALHAAVNGNHVQIANTLLDRGALQLQNNERFTPLLLASNRCEIEMVECIINRPECTKEQRIEGLELLGATIANERRVYDINKAFSCMKRGMEERYEDPLHPLLKKQMEPLKAYQNRKESQTLQELLLLEGDEHAIRMEGFVIRERILGTDNREICGLLRFRGSDFADSGNIDLCIGLWERAMEINQRCNQPDAIKFFFVNCAELFGKMVQHNRLLPTKLIEEVFEKLVLECERLKETSQSNPQVQEARQKEQLLYCALYLLMIYTKVQVTTNMENSGIFDLLQRFLRLNIRTRYGNTLLHLAAWYKAPIKEEILYIPAVFKLPCVETIKLIIRVGCDVNAFNIYGETPLHLAVTFKPNVNGIQVLEDMLEALLDGGAHEDLVNSEGKTAMDIAESDEARRILSVKSRLELKCIAARAVRKFGLSYFGVVPKTVEKFISLH